MAEIIPSINVSSFEEVKERIRRVEPHVSWAHLDISDGVFTKHASWHEPKDLFGFETTLKLEVHLMIQSPEREIYLWLGTPASRLIFHQEATKNPTFLIEKIHAAKKEAGIAINPDTSWLKLFRYFGKVELLQLLAVPPGPSGQEFQEEILHKLSHVRSLCKECTIEIDGGVDWRIARRCVRAGADVLVAGNYIFNSSDIKKAVENLRAVAEHHGSFARRKD